MKMAKYFLAALIVGAALPARGEMDTVLVRDFNFFPSALVIQKGDTVLWRVTQRCCLQHTTTRASTPMTWDSGPLDLGDTYRLPFPDTGTFGYFCDPHAPLGMAGSIRVESPPFLKASTLGWLGLLLLAASLSAAGIWILEKKRQAA